MPSEKPAHSNYLLLGSFCLPAIIKAFEENPELLQTVNNIILVESSCQNFTSSLQYFDFSRLLHLFKAHKISFELIIDEVYVNLVEKAYQYISSANPFLLYSLCVVKQNLLCPSLIQFEDWILSQTGIGYRFVASLGFSTDEINQCENAFSSYFTYSLQGINNCSLDHSRLTVVTGSGPSLDEHLDWLHRYSESINIFCAGSSVKSLLCNQIVPNYLVIHERDPIVYDYLCDLITEFPALNEVTLLASDTVDTRIFGLFGNKYIFQRPKSAVSPLYYENRPHVLPIGGPESVNACFECALSLNSTNILLLGCDFAASSRNKVRSTNAFGVSPRDFDIPVAGNKGKTVFSQLSLLFVKQAMESVITLYPKVNVLRAGEGASMDFAINIELSDSVAPNSLLASSSSNDSPNNRNSIPFTYTQESLLLRRNQLIESINSLIDSLIFDVDAANCWSTELEKRLVRYLTDDLLHSEEDLVVLAARRLLKHVLYHLLYQLFKHRSSPATWVSSKQLLVSQLLFLKENLTLYISDHFTSASCAA